MKKILIILLLLTFYCNNSFAKEFPLAGSVNSKTDPDFYKNYRKLAFFAKSNLDCKITKTASKENNFIEESVCDNNGGSVGCIVYLDKKVNPLPREMYCYSSIDLVAAR